MLSPCLTLLSLPGGAIARDHREDGIGNLFVDTDDISIASQDYNRLLLRKMDQHLPATRLTTNCFLMEEAGRPRSFHQVRCAQRLAGAPVIVMQQHAQ